MFRLRRAFFVAQVFHYCALIYRCILHTLCNYRNVSKHSIGTVNGFVARIVDVLDSGVLIVIELTYYCYHWVWEIGYEFIHELLVLRDYASNINKIKCNTCDSTVGVRGTDNNIPTWRRFHCKELIIRNE